MPNLQDALHEQPPVANELPNAKTGRWVVLSMFGFAILLIGTLWFYSDWHTAPFRPLRRALAREFENSAPKVEGGQEKMHKGTPKMLRVVMRVEFDPKADPERAETFARRVVDFSQRHHDLTPYEKIDVHLYHLEPEQRINEWSIEIAPEKTAPAH